MIITVNEYLAYAVRVAITVNIYNFYFLCLRVFYCYVTSCAHVISFLILILSQISSAVKLGACSLLLFILYKINKTYTRSLELEAFLSF